MTRTAIRTQTPPAYADRRQDFSGDYSPAMKLTLDFSNAENPLGCAPGAKQALEGLARQAGHYPEPRAERLCAALRQVYDLPGKGLDVIATAGAGAGILLCVQALLQSGACVVMPEITFPLALFGASAKGGFGRMVRVDAQMGIDLAALAQAVDQKTAMVFIANPNNPTGALLPLAALTTFAAQVNVPVIVSEANADYTGQSLLDGPALPPNMVVVRSFSKIHGLAGLRAGAVIAAGPLIARLHAVHCPFAVSLPAAEAAIAALADTAHVQRSRDYMTQQRTFLTHALGRLGMGVLPSAANTMLVRAPERFGTGAAFAAALAQKGCSVVDGGAFGPDAAHYIRIAPRDAARNAAFVRLLGGF